jgi:hypothetical protein
MAHYVFSLWGTTRNLATQAHYLAHSCLEEEEEKQDQEEEEEEEGRRRRRRRRNIFSKLGYIRPNIKKKIIIKKKNQIQDFRIFHLKFAGGC